MQEYGGTSVFDATNPVSVTEGPLASLQLRLSELLGRFMRGLGEDGSAEIWILLLLFAVLYGMIHAALPGHRKTLLVSYFLAENARPAEGILAAVALAVLHVVAAVIIVFGGYYLLDTALETVVGDASAAIHRLTGVLIALLGLYLLLARSMELIRSKGLHQADHHADGHGHHGDVEAPQTGRGKSRMLPLVIVSGIVPCPGSALILLTALSLGRPVIGIAAVVAVSVGMALTLTALSLITIVTKDRALRLLSSNAAHTAHAGVELAGAAVMLGFGTVIVMLAV